MTIRRRARLDPGQVRDLRGAGGVALGGGIGGIILIAVVMLLGGDPSQLPLDALSGQRAGTEQANDLSDECQTGADAAEDKACRIVAYVNSIQEYWSEEMGGEYQEAVTTFFTGSVQTACGNATSQVGPFYCPQDQGVYIDLGFFDVLEQQLGAEGGDFAEAYVIAHEYGHHVQNLTGVLTAGGGGQGAESRAVRTELQADCYAGVWGANAVETGFLEPITDEQIAQAMDTAESIGDDRIQQKTQGQVNPETWTHGSSEQRQEWFRTGLQRGDPASCDTFEADLDA
ncbi:MAG TPA: neutral zinc metallopeptidase [Candidatus Limnocylindria bacterium]|nr:neutral zinc metallopeptidase [Candidatus Limnocylindria bacterium]